MALLKTNDNCEGSYNGITLETEKGIVKAQTLKDAFISWELAINKILEFVKIFN